MKQSQLFTKTLKDVSKEEVSLNAQLLIRAGFIDKEMAGVYSYLPLGLRVLRKIEQIIREEMNAIDGQEVLLTTLQSKEHWQATNRWNDDVMDIWFKTKLKNEVELGLAPTHEEPLTLIMRKHIHSYKDLPKYVYQFQTKFRNEIRSKSGLMRGREFLMKDLYSFSRTTEELDDYYEKVKDAYMKVYSRLGLGEITYITFASGGSFSKFSHEFQTISEVGEDTIYVDEEKRIAINKEVYTDEVFEMLNIDKNKLVEKKAVEAGNIFKLGTKYSEALNLKFVDKDGSTKPVIMGSYGIGVSRVMGIIAEIFNDENGLIWPENIAPYRVHLVGLNLDEQPVKERADNIYTKLKANNIEVLYDDRLDVTPGQKFAESDLIGIPHRIVVSKRTEDKVEYKKRDESSADLTEFHKILETLIN